MSRSASWCGAVARTTCLQQQAGRTSASSALRPSWHRWQLHMLLQQQRQLQQLTSSRRQRCSTSTTSTTRSTTTCLAWPFLQAPGLLQQLLLPLLLPLLLVVVVVALQDPRSSQQQQQLQQTLLHHPSTAAEAVHSYRAPASLLGMQWTYDADGLLLSDAAANIIMLQVKRKRQQRQRQAQLDGSVAAGTAAEAEADASTPGQQQQQQQQQQQPGHISSWSVAELWRAHAEAPHFLIAAGSSALRPSASVQLDNAQRVIVWWPTADAKATEGCRVGAEVIRHPVKALHIQWSPPLALPSGSGASSCGTAPLPGAPAAAPAAAESTAGEGAAGSSSSTAGSGVSCSSGTAAGEVQSQGQAALMTVGADGIIRVFVEVVMADIAPTLPPAAPSSSSAAASTGKGTAAGSAAAAPGSPAVNPAAAAAAVMSQFCLTLVIEPPGLGPQVSGVRPGLLASWARPLQPQPPGQQPGMLWLLGSFVGPDLPSQPPLAAALSGTEAAAAAAAAAAGSSSSGVYQDQVFLWGVDGLAGVVLSGIAQNAIMSNKMSQPKVWCWGREAAQLRWQQPHALLQQAAAAVGTAPGSRGAVSAAVLAGAGGVAALRHSLDVWVVESGAGPLLSAAQQFRAPHHTALGGSSSSSTCSSADAASPTPSAAAAAAVTAVLPAGGVGLSECRCFQVTPLTGYNEGGQPASAIAVGLKHSRLHAGQAEEWVQVRSTAGFSAVTVTVMRSWSCCL
ncbi:hypothetical protein COO60DRAFT_115252 [Scenedesmus sp. NREL 46B-D3]|nr:hypothetical protein COO60DRAFT_115252 [Scenedesmus sp. NREL 46B-D3]